LKIREKSCLESFYYYKQIFYWKLLGIWNNCFCTKNKLYIPKRKFYLKWKKYRTDLQEFLRKQEILLLVQKESGVKFSLGYNSDLRVWNLA
jgi:hypothetical protein